MFDCCLVVVYEVDGFLLWVLCLLVFECGFKRLGLLGHCFLLGF